MVFSVGTKVKFLHTGDEGVITKLLDNGMVNVYIAEDDMEIPASLEDLIRSEKFMPKPAIKAKIVQGKKEKKPEKPIRPPAESQYTILKSFGIQIAFDPVLNDDGSTEKYMMYLINDTRHDVIYNLKLSFWGEEELVWNGKLDNTSYLKLGALLYDDLNDSPSFDLECWVSTTEGKGEKLTKSIKIKAKQFFKNIRTAPFLNKRTHIYRLIEKFETTDKKSKEDLINYTKRNTRPVKFQKRNNVTHSFSQFDSKEFAEFNPEIDLHIEKLMEKPHKMSNAEIV